MYTSNRNPYLQFRFYGKAWLPLKNKSSYRKSGKHRFIRENKNTVFYNEKKNSIFNKILY